MKKRYGKFLSLLCALALVASLAPVQVAAAPTLNAGGWFESLYAELPGVTDKQITAVSYSGTMSGALTGDDLTYLVRDVNGVARIDIPGLKEGTYSLTVTANGTNYTADGIQVMAYDRSGYAHWNYTNGVGAYNDDGTLKANALVLYVTDANKETVKFTSSKGTITGIGKILNNASANNATFKALFDTDKRPLVVRFVGNVTAPTGLTEPSYYKDDKGEWDGDNGSMAMIKNGANVTLEGIGADATIDGWGFDWGINSSAYASNQNLGKNFEVRNLSFRNAPEDCASAGGADVTTAPVERIWVHNCAFYVPSVPDTPVEDKHEGDGAVDFKRGSYLTMSYNYFEGYHKTNLVGSSDSVEQYHITWHHNWWKDCQSRGPLGRKADMHIYNNIYEGQTSYCMSLRANCYIFSEYNSFINCNDPARDEGSGGVCKSYQDTFTNCKGRKDMTIVTAKTKTVTSANKYANFDTNASLSYIPSGNYLLDESAAAVKTNIDAYAGPMKPAAEISTPGHVHAWSDWKTTKAATCTAAGVQTRTCNAADCPIGTQTQTVSALGHNYQNGVCARCGDKKLAKTYILTGDEVYAAMEQSTPAGFTKNPSTGTNPNSYVAGSAVTGTAGTDNFFTLYYTSGTRIDPSAKTFDDGYEAAYRVNFQGAATTTQNAVRFTTDDACTVKVWWVSGAGSDKAARSMTILNSSGQSYVTSTQSSNSTETPMFSTLELDQGGTWYLGGKGGKNFIYKVEVTVGSFVEDPVVELPYTLDADKNTLTINGSVPAGETVWCASWDGRDGFLDDYALTGDSPSVTLPQDWTRVKLIWLDSRLAPRRPAELIQK